MLGQDVMALLADRGEQVVGFDRDTVDLTDPAAVAGVAEGHDIVLNCAAFTAVDAAESDEATAFAVNAVAAANLARETNRAGARMIQISTDYVFDGAATEPYAEDAPAAPRSAYGRTKLAGEWAVRAECADHLVVRTAWLYGAHGPCFPRTIVRVAGERGGLDVVADQVGQPTWTVDLADLVHRMVGAGVPSGTYHGTSSGRTTLARLRAGGCRLGRDGPGGRRRRRAARPSSGRRPGPRGRSSVTTGCARWVSSPSVPGTSGGPWRRAIVLDARAGAQPSCSSRPSR